MTDTTFLPDGYHALAPGKLANIATFLEVTERPDRPRRPAPAGYVIEPVDRWDTDAFRPAMLRNLHLLRDFCAPLQ